MEGWRHELMEERKKKGSHRAAMACGQLSFPVVPHFCCRGERKLKELETAEEKQRKDWREKSGADLLVFV